MTETPSGNRSDAIAEKAFRLFGRFDTSRIDDRCRSLLVVKSRWLFLGILALYACAVAAGFSVSSHHVVFTYSQKVLLLISAVVAIISNSFFHIVSNRTRHNRYLSRSQLYVDLMLVTLIIHLTGGAGSWLWPIYVLVTIEAAFLFERTVMVWLYGALGSAAFGSLLAMEYFGLSEYVRMPFVDPTLNRDYFYLALLWGWVALLNTAVAVIATFLMSIIRQESEQVRKGEERLLNFIETAHDLIQSTNKNGEFIFVNRTWSRTLGYSLEELAGKTLYDLVPEEHRSLLAEEIDAVIEEGRDNLLETVFQTKAGKMIEVEGSLTRGFSTEDDASVVWGISRDISERKEVQRQLYRLAHFDPLTGLPNRVLFVDRLKQTKAQAQRHKRIMAVAFVDLDRFKVINDTLGHPVGDQLLRSVGERLNATVREVDTVARIGGDEFVIILGDLREQSDAERVVKKLIDGMSDPFNVDQHELFISCSIGVSLYPHDDAEMNNLMKKADLAMYAAKAKGRNSFCFYSPDMDEHAHRRFVLENGMRRAIEQKEFLLYYQPKIDVVSGAMTSMEALLRWSHPELGILSPADFIPLAEESGLIIPLGRWVLQEACRQNKLWQAEGLCSLRVAVNVSGYQLQHPDFVQIVMAVLEETGLSANYLELEITESVIMQHPEYVVGILNRLREAGIHISIDDFGTGYSSLSHLKRFSVNSLKIDKAFVKEIDNNATDAAIANAIVAMGASLNLKVIAEGVERQAQFTILQNTKCDEVQGYLFSRPVPPEGIEAFIREEKEKINRKLEEGDFS